MIDKERIWIADSEVFKYDTFWVFLNLVSGEVATIHNDNLALNVFIQEYDPILCGFNFRDYDQHILKACMLDWEPEEIKELNDIIISNHDNPLAPYEHFNGERWVDLPPIIDLFHDIVNKPGLKQIEGFMGASIMESNVPFDIDRPLTQEEIAEVFSYCEHDVMRTFDLFWLREKYLNNKVKLCSLFDVDPLKELKHPNARVVADLFEARATQFDNEDYVFPDNLRQDRIPSPAWHFANMLDRNEGSRTSKEDPNHPHNIYFMFHGNVTTMGVGGLHSAVGGLTPTYKKKSFYKTVPTTVPYQERATEDRVILIQDIGSYYPSLIINNGYASRAIPPQNVGVYEDFYHLRMKAKLEGDKDTADAAKLPLNIFYGCMKSKTNKLSDSMQGTNVCISGQLYMLDVVDGMAQAAPSLKLIQINTDGWIISVDKSELKKVDAVVKEWSERTNFTVDTQEASYIAQRDVNNYLMVFCDGSIKVKGGTVGGYYGKEKDWAARGFAYSNTIVDKAIVDYLVYDTPIEETVSKETDLSRFQIITKASRSKYLRCWADCHETWRDPVGREKVRKTLGISKGYETYMVNRIYATKDPTKGKLMKETFRGNINEFPDTPDHCIVDNKAELSTEFLLTELDREWYNELIKKKLKAFVGKDYKNERGNEGKGTEASDHTEKAGANRQGSTKAYTVDIRTKAVDVPAVSRRSVECDGTRQLCGAYQLRIC